jgi:alkanesulfonate monooxygenase SsuD/methylene tetrahydromethanopterin reductase-like flavin-dependent oxidoreductase (luciferase family)
VKIGLQISSFTWPGGDAEIGETLARICRAADDAGFDSIWVMDHLFQIRSVGEIEEPMLEGMTALGYMAAYTKRARLGLMVGAVPYRHPGLWLKATTTLDVLSGGRAWLGIGAAWNVEEARSLGIPFPELPDRFRLLEDTLKMARQAWAGERDTGPFKGRVTSAARVMLSPQQLSTPRIPILVGGGGERTTLRLVARYADACNVFGAPDMLVHKYEPGDGLDHARRSAGLADAGKADRAARGMGGSRLAPGDLLDPRRERRLEDRADRPRGHP